MKDLIKLYKNLLTKLPKTVKDKISNSEKERGYGGVYTKRNSRFGKVIIMFDSFTKLWKSDKEVLKNTFELGFRVLCTPEEYSLNREKLTEIPLIVRYLTYDEKEKFPFVDWQNVKTDKSAYSDNDVMFVFDGSDVNNRKTNLYVGPKLIGRHEMDYASKDEILKVKMVLLYQMINCYDFQNVMSGDPNLEKYLEYSSKFEQTSLYLDNSKLQEYTKKYGYTVCPEMIEFPNKGYAKISFLDIVNGTIFGDVGREDFNRTTTMINLHHKERLISGKLNHNHKNVFLGTACGNGIDAALRNNNFKLSDLMIS